MSWPRRLPPVYTPVTRDGLRAACSAALGRGDDPRKELAALLRSRFDARVVHLTSSGTAALHVAIRLARVSAGNFAVALPAYGCFDIATAAVGAGLPIALYDIDPDTLAPDLDSLTAVLASGARIVVAAPIGGVPFHWQDLEHCAHAFGALVIEDAAQGHGAFWRGRPLGSLGRISVLSFGRGKGWSGGVGGAVLVRDRVLSEFSRGLPLPAPGLFDEARAWTVAAAMHALSNPARYAWPARMPWLHLGETRYHDPYPPAGISRAAAALLVASRAAADDEAALRRANARVLLDGLESHPEAAHRFDIVEGARPGYLRLPVRVSKPAEVLDARHGRRLGIARGYPSTLAELPAIRERARIVGALPGAATLVRELITLPTHSLVTSVERRAIVTACCASATVAGDPHRVYATPRERI